jgi:PAS domain S-box-containing protein
MELDIGRVVDALPGLVWTATTDGQADFLNRRWLEYTGLVEDEAKGIGWQSALHPDDVSAALQFWRERVAAGAAGEVEARLRRFDGAYRWFQFRFVPLADDGGKIIKWCGINTDIEDLKCAEMERAAGRDLKLVIDTMPALAWSSDPDGVAGFFNQHYLDYVGLSREQMRGWRWTAAIHRDDLDRVASTWADIRESGSVGTVEARLRRHDGVYRTFLFRATPERDDHGKIVRWHGVNTDIEDLKRAEVALRSNEHKLNLILDTIPTSIHVLGTDGSVMYVNQAVLDYTGFTKEDVRKENYRARLFHPDDLQRVHEERLAALRRPVPFELEMRTRSADGSYRWFLNRYSPLLDERGRLDRWYVAAFDIEDRKRAEEALRSSEHKLNLILNTIPSHIQVLGADGSVLYVNQATLDYTGLTRADVEKEDYRARIFHPVDWKNVQAKRLPALKLAVPFELEMRTLRGDGSYRWFLYRYSPLLNEQGALDRWYVASFDIEDSKRTAAELGRVNRLLNHAQRISHVGSFWADVDADEHLWSEELYRIFEMDPATDKISIQTVRERIHPDDVQRYDTFAAQSSDGREYEWSYRIAPKPGIVKHLHCVTHRVAEISDRLVFFGAIQDITEFRKVEDALRQSEAFLAHAQQMSHVGSFRSDLEADEHFWSGELYRIFELDPAATRLTIQTVREHIHPDDVAQYDALAAQSWNGGGYEWSFRIVTGQGAVKHLHTSCRQVTEITDRLVFFGTIQDVTAFKRVEDALRQSEALLADGEAVSGTGSFLWNLESGVIKWSSQLYRIYEFEDGSPVTVERIETRVHPDDRQQIADNVGQAGGTLHSEYEHRLLMPDGRIKHLLVVGRLETDRDGMLLQRGIVEDITERRRAEEALSRVRSELAHVTRVAALNTLTASIAHEVNQPLSGIMTNASTCLRMLAAEQPNLDGARITVQRLLRDVNRASEVIARLRTLFSKKEAALELVDLNEAAREVIALSQHELRRNDIAVRPDLDDDLPVVAGDRVQLQQVILNLILNASDAMCAVADRPRHLRVVTGLDEKGCVQLAVSDTGVGFGDGNVAGLFDAFYTTKPGGMGIGLSVSKSIIEAHHGQLLATPNEGPGATFLFTVPSAGEGAGRQTTNARGG